MKVYIAGPMRGYPQFNFPAFDEAKARGESLGWEVISPADIDREHDKDAGELTAEQADSRVKRYARRDTKAVLSLDPDNGDAIAVLPGWEKSKGATAEHALAVWIGLRVLDAQTFNDLEQGTSAMRTFETGATRSSSMGKPQYAGFTCPLVRARFGLYMLKHQTQADGKQRASDNWKKGMPLRDTAESLFRHWNDFLLWLDGWGIHPQDARDAQDVEEILCAVIFNANQLLRTVLLEKLKKEAA